MKRIKAYHIIIRTLCAILILIVILLIIIFGNGFFELGFINSDIEQFINNCEYEKTINYGEYEINLYSKKASYDYEKDNYIDTIQIKDDTIYLGNKSDIIITNRNPYGRIGGAFISDVVGMFTTPLNSGHATVNIDSESIIECVGNSDNNVVRIVNNEWFEDIIKYGEEKENYIGLRIKDFDNDKRNEFVRLLNNELGKKYTFSFLIHSKDTFYCTDLITRTIKKMNLKLNYDSFIATGNDILISNNTFIIFVVRKVDFKNKVINLYYMKEE